MQQHPVSVASRRRKLANLERDNPGAVLIDVTSRAEHPWVRFSPFYPHGNIPVPNSPALTSQSVEGVWQALKVFENEDVDLSKLNVANMKGIKRSVRTRGRVLGHRYGTASDELLSYQAARLQIYLPTYRHILDHFLSAEIRSLRTTLQSQPVVLLDYETNTDLTNLAKPLSHAGLVAAFIRDDWPTQDSLPEGPR